MANTSRLPGSTGNTGQTGQDLKHKAQEAASNLGQRAQEAASNVAQTARDTASNLGQRAQEASSNLGERISSLGETIRERGPQEGVLGNAASAVAGGLESGGRYLKDHDFGDMTNDIASLIRQNPIPSLLAGFGVGFLVGMALRR